MGILGCPNSTDDVQCYRRAAACIGLADQVQPPAGAAGFAEAQGDFEAGNCRSGSLWNESLRPLRQTVHFRPGRLVLFLAGTPHSVERITSQRDVMLLWWRD